MRWPFMLKRTHEADLKGAATIMQAAIDREHARATREGKAQVHAFMREAQAAVYASPRPEIAVRAVFQFAELKFGPPPTAVSDVLYAPANFEEAIDAAARS